VESTRIENGKWKFDDESANRIFARLVIDKAEKPSNRAQTQMQVNQGKSNQIRPNQTCKKKFNHEWTQMNTDCSRKNAKRRERRGRWRFDDRIRPKSG
jgi:hypothetical protein